jgi:hypothetical protein
MKKPVLYIFSLITILGFGFTGDQLQDEVYRSIANKSFKRGEVIEYRLHYGFINAGEGVVETSPDLYRINNRACYRVTVSGKTVGAFDAMYKVRDTWRSYIDTGALITQRFYWDIHEGGFTKEETVFFDHVNKKIRSEEKNEPTHEFDKIPDNLQDLISGYYYLRNLDFSTLKENDMIPVKGFFDDKYFDFKIKYKGKEVVKTKFGKINCLKLIPIMPKNDLFDGEGSISFFVTDDMNKIPVKVSAKMFIGAIEVDLKSYKNVRYPLSFK